MITLNEALRRGAQFLRAQGIESARLDMELILAETLGIDRLHLYMDMQRPLTPDEIERSRGLLDRRRRREPIAYIVGRKEFYSLDFKVSPAVLIPRPETEMLVDFALERLAARDEADGEPLLADIGTGSGAIAVATAAMQRCKGLPGRWIAVDDSEEALALARENAERHNVAERIEFRRGDMLAPLGGPVDCIVSNPPYVAETDRETLPPDVADWEPTAALFSGPTGMEHIARLAEGAAEALNPGGVLLFEFGENQRDAVETVLKEQSGLARLQVHCDLAGKWRIAEARREK